MMAATIDDVTSGDRPALLVLWGELIGRAPPKNLSLTFLQHILAFEIQSRALGGLRGETVRALERLRKGGKAGRRPSAPKPGARLIREWGGITHVIEITASGFRYRERDYRSLSEIARTITGARWSGPRFFGLQESRRG